MSTPTVFLSAASIDLKEWRDVLHDAFSRGGFRVLTQDHSLSSAPGDVKRLLTETIDESDCIIHLAGLGYGSDATAPFPADPDFQCSWTQFEYYHGHQEKKDVIAFVCAPSLSKSGFVEKGTDAADIARKQRLQQEHRQRVTQGTFEHTPVTAPRTSNESITSVGALLTAVAAAVGTLHKLDREACAKAQQQLSTLAEVVARIEAGVGSANEKLDQILTLLRPPVVAAPFQLPTAASRYFGRAALIADLEGRLRRQKRTEVWGGPGIGKTALAAEAVGRIVGDDPTALAGSPFPQGVVFLDLYRFKDLDNAWNALANAFDDSLPTDMKAADRAAKGCAQRRALIILEGAEELGTRLNDLLTVLAPESTLLVLTREGTQTAAGRRLRLDDLLEDADALALLRHLAGAAVPEAILTTVQARLGGHPLALTWAGSQLGDATQPPAHFLRDLVAEPFTKLTEPGGDPGHTLRWMFDRSVRLLADSTRTVLAAVARLSEPFEESWAQVADGAESDLQRLVQLSFLRVSSEPTGWQFAHALAAQNARALPLPEGLMERLGHHALAGITAADARCHAEGPAPLGLALAHATALLGHDASSRTLGFVWEALLYHDRNNDPVGIRRGRLDFARSAVGAVRAWQEQASAEEKATPGWQRENASVFSKLGDLAVAQGDLAGALRSFTQSKTIFERLAASAPANADWQRNLSVSLYRLADIDEKQGNIPEALRWFTGYKEIIERLAAADPSSATLQSDVARALDRLSDLAVAQGDLAGALRSYSESKTIRERLVGSDPANAERQRDLSISLHRLADTYEKQGNIPEALRWFTGYKEIIERLAAADPSSATLQSDVARSMHRLGNLAKAQGDLAGALRSYSESKTIRERLAASDPSNAVWQRDLASSLNGLGNLAVAQGDLAGALRSFTESKTIAERLAASDPANAEWQRDLAQSHCLVGMVEQQSGDLAKAKTSFVHYKDTMERLATSAPANAEWQRDLYVSKINLGDLAVTQGDLAGALRSYTESKTVAERLATSDPANAGWQRDLYALLSRLGDLAVTQGDLAGALRSFTEAKTIAERLTASDPANAAWQRDLSFSYYLIAAKVFQPQERWAEALELMEKSLRISERLAATDPTNVMWQNDVKVNRALVAELRAKVGK